MNTVVLVVVVIVVNVLVTVVVFVVVVVVIVVMVIVISSTAMHYVRPNSFPSHDVRFNTPPTTVNIPCSVAFKIF